MPDKPRVSVIIPTLNEESVLENLLSSLSKLKSVYPLELVVVDGGSQDQTQWIAQRFCDRVIITAPGRGGQLNRGVQYTSGEVLWFVHADSRIENDPVCRILKSIENGSGGGCFRLAFDREELGYRVIAWGSNVRAKWLKSYYGDQGIFVRRDVFDRLEGFCNIPLMEDLEFSQRLKKIAKLEVVDSVIQTSARRFQKGILRTIFFMQVLKLGYYLGVDTKRLAKIYGSGKRFKRM